MSSFRGFVGFVFLALAVAVEVTGGSEVAAFGFLVCANVWFAAIREDT